MDETNVIYGKNDSKPLLHAGSQGFILLIRQETLHWESAFL